ncbi:MAG: DUF11 domain-containing protein, partial [Armatimonadetes bacterium]|nr:DUF11 domain-containing protein [Armatimonadota bacterium]
MPAKDIVYDPLSQKIYASLPSIFRPGGNSIARIDPYTGSIEATVFVGSEPGKLALSDNGQYLYVALEGAGAIRRVDLKSFAAGLQFSLGNALYDGFYFAEDLEVLPGTPESVAVSLYKKGVTPRHAGVAIYDNGVRRPKTSQDHTGSNVIVFSDTASRLYGLSLEMSQGVRRLTVDESGVTELDVIPNDIQAKIFFGWLGDIKYHNGLLYSPGGYTLDPEKKRGGPYYDNHEHFYNEGPLFESQLIEPDSKYDRVYLLYKYAGRNAKIHVFKMGSLGSSKPLRTLQVPGVTGKILRFTRWGADGLAFLTASGQLFLLRSPLFFPAEPSADLSVDQSAIPTTVSRGETQTFTLTVKNRGPHTATGVSLFDTLSPGVIFVSAVPSQGSCTESEGRLHCSFGELARDAVALVNVKVKSLDAWTIHNTVRVVSKDVEANWTDNENTLTTLVHHRLDAEDQGRIALPTNDLIYDPLRDKVYASVPESAGASGGSLAIIEPRSGTVVQRLSIGKEPNRLAISDNGEYLYVGLDGEAAVLRIDLSDKEKWKRYPLYPADLAGGAPYALDIEVLPGTPTSIAVSRAQKNYSGVYLVIIDEGGIRLGALDNHFRYSPRQIEPSENPFVLYGTSHSSRNDLIRYSLDAIGMAREQETLEIIPASDDIEYDRGRLFTSSGKILDPEMPGVLGQFYGVPSPARVAPDAYTGRVFFLGGDGPTRQILAYNRRTQVLIGSIPASGVSGKARSFIRWGGDGLAFRTDSGEIVLLRSSLVPEVKKTGRLSVTQVASPDPVGLDEDLTYRIRVVNEGPDPAESVTLYDYLPASVKVVSARSDRAGCADLPGRIRCDLGTIAVGARVEVTIIVRPQVAAPLYNRVRVASDTFDPVWADNLSQLETNTHFALGPNRRGRLALRTRDLLYDPIRRKIYASVPDNSGERGNSIAIIDPFAGTLGPFVPIGKDPGKLAISDDGRYLYVALNGAGTVRRVDLSDFKTDLEFSLGSSPNWGAYFARDLKTVPGHPETIVVLKMPMSDPYRLGAVTVYDNGIPRPKELVGEYEISWIGTADIPGRVYAFGYKRMVGEGFFRLTLEEAGLIEQDFTYQMSGGEIEQGRMYNPGGAVYDVESRVLLGTYTPAPGVPAPLEPDTSAGRTFFLFGGHYGSHTLRVFDQETFLLLDTFSFPDSAGYPGSLIRWGADGLVYRTDRDQVVLFRTRWRLPR